MFINLTKLAKILKKKNSVQQLCLISVGAGTVICEMFQNDNEVDALADCSELSMFINASSLPLILFEVNRVLGQEKLFVKYYSQRFYKKSRMGDLTLPVPCISESCIEVKIKLNFYFRTSLWCLKRFYERLRKIFQGTTKKCENENLT